MSTASLHRNTSWWRRFPPRLVSASRIALCVHGDPEEHCNAFARRCAFEVEEEDLEELLVELLEELEEARWRMLDRVS